MPLFRYKAFDDAGKLCEGNLEAPTSQIAVEQLYNRNLYPFDTALVDTEITERWWNREIFGSHTLPGEKLASFTRELATLVSAEIPLDESLQIIVDQAPNKQIKKISTKIHDKIVGGANLSQACAANKNIFPNYFLSMLAAGEASGSLGKILLELAQYIERSQEIQSRLRSALVYPIILVFMAVLAIVTIVMFLIPNIAPLFIDAGAKMPFIIGAVLSLQQILADHWIFITISIVTLLALLLTLFRQTWFRLRFDTIILSFPIIGSMVSSAETAKFTRTLGTLLANGVSLLPALQITHSVVSNRAIIKALINVSEGLKEGKKMSERLTTSFLFPPMAVRLIAVGEKSGKLENMLFHIAEILEKRLQQKIDRLLSLLTPALTLIIGLGIGSLIMSVMDAILSVNDLIL